MTKNKKIKIKICLLGDPAVGKTSLVQKYVLNFFSDDYMRTMGTNVSRKVIQVQEAESDINYEVTMMIWDIMGQQFSTMPLDNYFRMSQGALIVCDVIRRDTFKNLVEWKKTLIKCSGEVPIIYLANKIDLEKDLDFSLHEFQKFCKKEDSDFFYTSAKTGENVNPAFQKLGEQIISIDLKTPLESTKEPSIPEFGKIEEIIQQTVKRPQLNKALSQQKVMNTQSQSGTNQSENNSIDIDMNKIKSGIGYIIKEEKPDQSFSIFKKLLQEGVHGLCITRMHPRRINEEYMLDNIPIYWLSTNAHNQKNVVAPTFLPQLNTIITDFINNFNDVVILLEGVEYLIEQNDFNTVLNLIHSLNDHIMSSNARLILPVDPLILKEREIHMLSRDLKILL